MPQITDQTPLKEALSCAFSIMEDFGVTSGTLVDAQDCLCLEGALAIGAGMPHDALVRFSHNFDAFAAEESGLAYQLREPGWEIIKDDDYRKAAEDAARVVVKIGQEFRDTLGQAPYVWNDEAVRQSQAALEGGIESPPVRK